MEYENIYEILITTSDWATSSCHLKVLKLHRTYETLIAMSAQSVQRFLIVQNDNTQVIG